MALRSMTAFSMAEALYGDVRLVWELKSVNGKGLELRLRLPVGLEALEPSVRETIAAHLARGTCAAHLKVETCCESGMLRIDEAAFSSLLEDARLMSQKYGLPPPDLGVLLNVRGVVREASASEPPPIDDLAGRCLALLEEGLSRLEEARRGEGDRLHALLGSHLDKIEDLVSKVRPLVEDAPGYLHDRLKAQVSRLLGDEETLDAHRLHQEAVLLAARSDVSEEIDRLDGHTSVARELIDGDGAPVGRRLDFLAQEMHREANTLCSKSHAKDVTMIGLELKVFIDRFREQVQNIQ